MLEMQNRPQVGVGRRVVVSRVGGPEVKPPGWHYAGHVVDFNHEAARIRFENGVGEHVFSLVTGLWLEGENMQLEDCLLRDFDYVGLRELAMPEKLPMPSADVGGYGVCTTTTAAVGKVESGLSTAPAGRINGFRSPRV